MTILSRNSTVLIAEDEESEKVFATSTFTEKGFNVLAASSAEDALQLWEDHRDEISLLFTDLLLPGMSGFHLAREIRATRPELPVIFSSGDSATLLQNDTGFDDDVKYLFKPYRSSELSAVISGMMTAN